MARCVDIAEFPLTQNLHKHCVNLVMNPHITWHPARWGPLANLTMFTKDQSMQCRLR